MKRRKREYKPKPKVPESLRLDEQQTLFRCARCSFSRVQKHSPTTVVRDWCPKCGREMRGTSKNEHRSSQGNHQHTGTGKLAELARVDANLTADTAALTAAFKDISRTLASLSRAGIFTPAQVRIMMGIDVAPAVPEREDTVPIFAYKEAYVVRSGRTFMFRPLAQSHLLYGADEHAVLCHDDHPKPHCSCGFYAWSDSSSRQDPLGWCTTRWSASLAEVFSPMPPTQMRVALDVELFGKVIVHESGYRASRQRVISMRPKCAVCGGPVTRWFAYRGREDVIPMCDTNHPVPEHTKWFTNEDVEKRLGVSIRDPRPE